MDNILTLFAALAVLIVAFGVSTVAYMAAVHRYACRVNAECRECIANTLGAPVPVEPEPETDEARDAREAINRRILGILITTLTLPDAGGSV